MKIDFPLPTDGKRHEYCSSCHSENFSRVFEGEKTFYRCHDCGDKSPRRIVIDPQIVWWIDDQTKEYWHESVGIFIFNEEGKALFFLRVLYPFASTIPAGHLDVGETVDAAVKREVREETGLELSAVKLFSEEDIVGDRCGRGADVHKWHLYTAHVKGNTPVRINDEGGKPVWLSLDEALKKDLVYVVRYFIEKYGQKLMQA
ncbi:NUDIX hydrolase [Patescibacteria group bacterium]|nr:NUDIX hydrolase [Patescibacteria group bacterium]